jgi:hypothetical protein
MLRSHLSRAPRDVLRHRLDPGEKCWKSGVDHRDGTGADAVRMDEDLSENSRDHDFLVISGGQECGNGPLVVLIGRAEVGDEDARVED